MADLTVTITDSISISGKKMGSEREQTITGINRVSQGVVSVIATAQSIIMGFDTKAGGLYTLEQGTLKYARLTNLDSTNSMFLSYFTDDGVSTPPDDVSNIEIPAGCSFVVYSDEGATDSSFISSYLNIYKMELRATGADLLADVFYATT
jgi:hypothetical protein